MTDAWVFRNKGGAIIKTAPQVAMDCQNYYTACGGGNGYYGFDGYKNYGIYTQTQYPYTQLDQTCTATLAGSAY